MASPTVSTAPATSSGLFVNASVGQRPFGAISAWIIAAGGTFVLPRLFQVLRPRPGSLRDAQGGGPDHETIMKKRSMQGTGGAATWRSLFKSSGSVGGRHWVNETGGMT